jgi:hypothetical protein
MESLVLRTNKLMGYVYIPFISSLTTCFNEQACLDVTQGARHVVSRQNILKLQ